MIYDLSVCQFEKFFVIQTIILSNLLRSFKDLSLALNLSVNEDEYFLVNSISGAMVHRQSPPMMKDVEESLEQCPAMMFPEILSAGKSIRRTG